MGLTENTVTTLLALNGLGVRPKSAVSVEGLEAGLVGEDQKVAVLAPAGSRVTSEFEGESSVVGGRTLVLGPWMSCADCSHGCARGLSARAPLRASATGLASPPQATSWPCAPPAEGPHPSSPSSP
jgi:hypothetical protein